MGCKTSDLFSRRSLVAVPILSDAQNLASGRGYAHKEGDRSVIGLKDPRRDLAASYVSYRTGGTTVLHILRSRELAIDAACRFLDRGYHGSLEVGPMLGPREGNVLAEADIRRIQKAGRSSPTALTEPGFTGLYRG